MKSHSSLLLELSAVSDWEDEGDSFCYKSYEGEF